MHAATEDRYTRLTWPEVNDAIAAQKLVILPTASTEQHGKHLPKVPGYLLLLEFGWTSHLGSGRDDAVRAVLDRFQADEDGFVVIRDAAESRRLRKAVTAVPDALIFERH